MVVNEPCNLKKKKKQKHNSDLAQQKSQQLPNA